MPGNILIVDDDDAIRETMVSALEILGYGADSASNGQEALEKIANSRPCLILLDLMMPVMDGSQFCKAQQNDPTIADIPVIVFSADVAVAKKASLLNAVGSLKKPIDLLTLKAVVQDFCGESHRA